MKVLNVKTCVLPNCRNPDNHDDECFQIIVDVVGRMSLSLLRKCTVRIRILARVSLNDNVDDCV